MIVRVLGLSGLRNAYRSVLSAAGSSEMSGASRWLEALPASGCVPRVNAASRIAAAAPRKTSASLRILLRLLSSTGRRSFARAPRVVRSGLCAEPFREERLDDAVLAVAPAGELVLRQRLERPLHRRRAREVVPVAIAAGQRPSRLACERLKREPLRRRRALPDEAEVRVLGAQHRAQRVLDELAARPPARTRDLPEEVAELLGGVRVPRRDVQHVRHGLFRDPLPGRLEPLSDVGPEVVRRDHVQLHLLRAPPEGLVLVVAEVRAQLADFGVAVGERLVQGESAEAEWVGLWLAHGPILRTFALCKIA